MILPINFNNLQGQLIYLAKAPVIYEGKTALLVVKRLKAIHLNDPAKLEKIKGRLAFYNNVDATQSSIHLQQQAHQIALLGPMHLVFRSNKITEKVLHAVAITVMSAEESLRFQQAATTAIEAAAVPAARKNEDRKNPSARALPPTKEVSSAQSPSLPHAVVRSKTERSESIKKEHTLDEAAAEKRSNEHRRYEKKLQEKLLLESLLKCERLELSLL